MLSLRRFLVYGVGRLIPDRIWIQIKYLQWLGRFADLKNPQTFNEKLQWLKLYDRKPEYTMMVDKYDSKIWVADKIGQEFIIPVIGGPWHSFDDIDFNELPNQFVLKTTHDCGGVIICKDKSAFNKNEAKKIINLHLRSNYFLTCREWPYKNTKPRIFAEQYMEDAGKNYLPVYKIMCFNGEPKIIQTIQNDKQPNETIDYFDINWNRLQLKQNFPNSTKPLSKPLRYNEMVSIARNLSRGRSFLRVDLYVINNKIYFSECTFYSDAGFAKFEPEIWDSILGEWINLSERK